MAIAVNDSNFEEIVLKAEHPVLVDFWAEWCGPCKMMLPIVEELSKEYEGKITVAKVDVDSSATIQAASVSATSRPSSFSKTGKSWTNKWEPCPKQRW